jgi:drug/metabolite transporter (DMT)-like permease
MKLLYGALALSQVAVGINVIIAKYFIERISLPLFIEIRFLGSSFILLLCFLLLKGRIYKAPIQWSSLSGRQRIQDMSLILALFVMGGLLFNVLMVIGLDYSGAANVGVISATLTPIVMFFSWWLLKERLCSALIAALVLSVAGVLCLSIHPVPTLENSHPLLGNLFAFLSILPEALFTILNKMSGQRFTALGKAVWINVLSCVFFIPWVLLQYDSGFGGIFYDVNMSWEAALLFMISSVTAVVFFWAWPYGVERVSANLTALFSGVMPITTVFLGVFYLREPFGFWQWLGMALVCASIVLGVALRKKAK